MATLTTFMPLVTYPEPVDLLAVQAASGFVVAIGGQLTVTAYPVDIPQISTPLGGMLLDLPALARAAEDKSVADAAIYRQTIEAHVGGQVDVGFLTQRVGLGAVNDAAVETARTFDLCVVPWAADAAAALDLIQALIFGAGRPVVMVPAGTISRRLDHIAIAWDGGRVAARALFDALALLAPGGTITVLTVADDKPLAGDDPASALAGTLRERGYRATGRNFALAGKPIATALQDAALDAGASLLAMGGFGHSRLRDFVLGGATTGILSDLRVPTLVSH